jgi:uncharacterized SAM-binding protein YcdF (DUF218 family)
VKDQTAIGNRKRAKAFRILFYGFCLFFLAWLLVAPFLAKLLIVSKALERADAIWVLGGSATYLERTHKAAELFKKGLAAKIFVVNDGVFGGWSKSEERNLPFSEISRRELVAQGVPVEAIEILPTLVDGTRDEAELFAATARGQNLRSILLVTSAYHSRRTLWTFNRGVLKNKLDIEIGLESPPPGEQTPPPFTWWLSRKGWMLVGEEYLKMAYYWLFY